MRLWKQKLSFLLACCLAFAMTACGKETDAKKQSGSEETEIQVFVAASLHTVMTELVTMYREEQPEVNITLHADSSGTLLTQIREGYECDLFFSAAQKQMDELEQAGRIVDGTRSDVVENQVVLLTGKDSKTEVTGLADLWKAKSIALAGGSVPVGSYTRRALVNLGVLSGEDASLISTKEVADALGGVEISEQDNVSKVLIAVAEGACEVGTTYYSDLYGYEDRVKVLENVSSELTGNVKYPICMVENPEADANQKEAAKGFLSFVTSDKAKAVFERYYFEPHVG